MKLLFSKPKIQSIGANAHIKSQLSSLNIEKEILTKTISRLYQHEIEISKIQRDRLLIRYQHQLGIVLAKIEKLDAASKHPDLGPLGDGLITLMDQKLSQLDKRLYELTSKINLSNQQIKEIKPKAEMSIKEEFKKTAEIPQIQKEVVKETTQETIQQKPSRPLEITTLTELPLKQIEFPLIEQKPRDIQMEIIQERIDNQQQKSEEKEETLQSSVTLTRIEKPNKGIDSTIQETLPTPIEQKPKPNIRIPEEENIDDDDDDLDRIKGEIMKTLSKLDQAEVE
jgi:hypothetical protein